MDEQITQLITEFANANNMDVAVVEELVTQAIAFTKPHAGGRPITDKTSKAREGIINSKDKIKNLTVKEISAMLDIDANDVHTAIRFFEKSGIFAKSGVKDKESGQKGRKETLWSSV